jgi:Fic family protein
MLDFRQSRPGTLSPFTAIADFQRWFVSIHPVGDGNGRVSRFIQDILLVNAGFFLMYPAFSLMMFLQQKKTIGMTLRNR